ncbi:hypothetical protein PJI17_29560 [Mycobacterium kansasii]
MWYEVRRSGTNRLPGHVGPVAPPDRKRPVIGVLEANHLVALRDTRSAGSSTGALPAVSARRRSPVVVVRCRW